MTKPLAIRVGQDLEILPQPSSPTLPDVLTLTSYSLGLWWSVGGPTWAALASIAFDELDGRVARATKTTSERGSALDWGADVILTPLALRRLGAAFGHPNAALLAAPPILYVQANMRAEGKRPTVGSARAAIMLAAILAEGVKKGSRDSGVKGEKK